MKVVDSNCEVEFVEQAEDNIVEEKQDMIVEIVEIDDIEDIEGTFHKYFSILMPKVEGKISTEWVQSNCFVMVVQMLEC